MRTGFGKWEMHLNLDEMTSWQYALPESFHLALQKYAYDPAHARPIPAGMFKRLMRKLQAFVDNSVGGNMLPAHNPRLHFDEVRNNALALFDLYYGAKAKTEFLFVRQMLEIAAYAHDCGHRGCTLRIDHIKSKYGRLMPLPLPELGTSISVEYVSALLLDEFLVQQTEVEISLAAHIFATGLIWATTFGHTAAVNRGLNFIPSPKPDSLYFAMMRAADCQPQPSFASYIDYGTRVYFGEIPATGKQLESTQSFLDSQGGFLTYCLEEQAALNRIAGIDLTAEAREVTQRHLRRIESIIAGRDPAGLMLVEAYARRWIG